MSPFLLLSHLWRLSSFLFVRIGTNIRGLTTWDFLGPEPENDSTGGKGENSTNVGGIAGGVIGGVAAVALGILAIWWFFLKKRKGKGAETLGSGSAAPSPATAQVTSGSPPELDGLCSEMVGRPVELEGEDHMVKSELDAGERMVGKPVQLTEQHGVSELPG